VVHVRPLVALVEELVQVVVVRLELARVPVVPLTRVDLAVEHEVVARAAIRLAEKSAAAKHEQQQNGFNKNKNKKTLSFLHIFKNKEVENDEILEMKIYFFFFF
jgi:hypothetical protein